MQCEIFLANSAITVYDKPMGSTACHSIGLSCTVMALFAKKHLMLHLKNNHEKVCVCCTLKKIMCSHIPLFLFFLFCFFCPLFVLSLSQVEDCFLAFYKAKGKHLIVVLVKCLPAFHDSSNNSLKTCSFSLLLACGLHCLH